MHAAQSYQKLWSEQYVDALLLCTDKKVCTNVAKEMNTSHDSMCRNFDNPIEKANALLDDLTTMTLNTLNLEELYLIFDDTQITKLYAKQVEGLEVGFDGSLGMAAPGMKMVAALLTDRKINIPINNAIPCFSKELAQGLYQTKSEIGVNITKFIIETFKITKILGDAHYATKQFVTRANNSCHS